MMGIGFLGYVNLAQNDNYKKISYNKFTLLNHSIKMSLPMSSNFSNTRFYSSSRIDMFLKTKNLNPVFIYDNIQDDSVKTQIITETKGLSGIYLILNKETLAFYIGSASTNKFNSRFINHLISLKGSKILKNSVKKYKLSNFCFIILELFPHAVTQENNKNLLDIEDFYIKSLLPDYNILTEAGSNFGYKYTEVSRLKMKSVYNEEYRKEIEELNNIKLPTINTIKQMNLNTEIKNSFKETLKDNSKAILVKELSSGIIYGRYSSIMEAALALNCSNKTIERILKTRKKILKRRWVVSYN
jgi:group I intron endonuclease